jgi:hypothetical protein
LILDATVVLAGERILSKLKVQIERGHHLAAADFNPRVYDKYRREYIAILDMIRFRNFKMDQRWFAFLGRMLKWATAEMGDDVEMPEEESADDAVESNVESEESVDEPGAEGMPI